MGAVVDDEGRKAEGARALREDRKAEFEGRIGEAALRIDPDDRRTCACGSKLGRGVRDRPCRP